MHLDATIPEELLSLLLDAPTMLEYDDAELDTFPLAIRRYTLSWHLVFDSFSSASDKVRSDYRTVISKGDYIGGFLSLMCDILSLSLAKPIQLEKENIAEDMIRRYDRQRAATLEESTQDMHWLFVNLYYLCLKYIPGEIKNWWLACKDRQTSITVQHWTEKYFTNLIVQELFDEVVQWSEEQKVDSDEDGKALSVKVLRNSREIAAGYEIDELEMKILISVPATYPLAATKVESVHRVGIPEKKWNGFITNTRGVIQFMVRTTFTRKVLPV